MSYPERWEPDQHMVASVLAMPKAYCKMTELPLVDRCWLTAGLTVYGLTVNQILDRMGCSERLVKSIRAEDMTRMATYAHEQVKALEDQLYAERSAHSATRRELELARREVVRVRGQMDQLVKKACSGESIEKCYRGHPILDGSRYRHGNREYCRECTRENTAAYRQRKRKQPDLQCHSIRMTSAVHPTSVASAL